VARQQEEIAELSTPVVKLWHGILALPLIGTLDSARTQVVMENLLHPSSTRRGDRHHRHHGRSDRGHPRGPAPPQDHRGGAPHGRGCIVSGIRPQIAQTMVHLGVELNVVSKASLADAFALALQRTGRTVVRSKSPASSAVPG
jgi:rsbT co-antagonist protein RsbR